MYVTVHLHGPFKGFTKGPVKIAATNAAEAITALTSQVKGFRPDSRGMKQVRLVGFDSDEDLVMPLKEGHEIHVIPNIWFNQKDGTLTQIVVGSVLITVGFLVGGPTNPFGTMLISMGASMVIGGVMHLLVPVPKPSKEEEERTKYLGSPPNTVGAGVRRPIGYGKDLVQGHILSSDIDAAELA